MNYDFMQMTSVKVKEQLEETTNMLAEEAIVVARSICLLGATEFEERCHRELNSDVCLAWIAEHLAYSQAVYSTSDEKWREDVKYNFKLATVFFERWRKVTSKVGEIEGLFE